MKNYVCGRCKREFNSKQALQKHKDEVCFKKPAVFSKIAVIILLVIAVSLLSTHTVHALSVPSGINNYVALNISNTQSTATLSPFQQMVNITNSVYKGYANATFNNVEFFYSNGTIIDSWLENYTYSKNALYWLKVGSIAASSKLTVYIGFASNSTNLFNTNTTGEAPTLSATYGEYDNGGNVFNYYTNFSGTSLPSGWTGADATVNNGLNVTTTSGYAQSGSSYGYGTEILDEYITQPPTISTTSGNGGYGFTDGATGWAGGANYEYLLNVYNGNKYLALIDGSGSSKIGSGVPAADKGIISMWYNSTDFYAMTDYGAISSDAADIGKSLPIGIDNIGSSSGGQPLFAQWIRIRQQPPNNVMPSVTFGAVTITTTLYLNGVSNANTMITYGTESNFTAERASSYISIYVNGTKVASLTQGKAVYLKTLSAGLYKITAVTNTSGVNNQTYYEKISKASDYLSLSSSPNINYTYNGTKANITAKVLSDVNSQLKNITFKVNNMTVKTFNSTGTASYSNAVAGTYTAVINSSGNQNYSSETSKLTIIISKANPLTAYYLFKTEAGLKNVTAYTTEPLSNIITSNAINNLSVSFYVEYPNGTLSEWQAGYIDKQGNISFADFVSQLDAVGTYKFYVSVAGNENYSSETSSTIYAVLSKPYPLLSIPSTSVFSNQNNTFTFSSAWNYSNLLYLQVKKVSNTTEPLLLNSSYIGSPSYQSGFAYPYIGNYSVTVLDTATNLSTTKYYIITAVQFLQCSSSSKYTVPSGGHIGKVFNLTVISAVNGKKLVNLSNVAGSMQAIGSPVVSTGQDLGFTNATNLKDGNFQICLLAGAGSSLNMNGTSSSVFYTNNYNITSSYYFLNTPIDWNSSAGTWVVHNIPLYSLNTTTGVGEFLFATQTSAGAQVAAYVQIYEYNPNLNSYDLEDFIQTSTQGNTPVILQNGQLYSFNVYNSKGALITSLSNQVLACTSASGCAEIITVNQNLYEFTTPSYKCTATNTSITCGVSSGSSGAIAYQLQVSSVGPAGSTPYCQQTLSSPNGDISCSLPSGGYAWQLTWENAAGQLLYLTGNNNSPITTSLFGTIGLIIGFFGVLILVLLATWSPAASIIILVLSTAIFSLLGLFAFTMEDISGLIILAAIYFWRYRQ